MKLKKSIALLEKLSKNAKDDNHLKELIRYEIEYRIKRAERLNRARKQNRKQTL